LEVQDVGALTTLYERVLDAFPDALLEDPHDLRPARPAPGAHRLSLGAERLTTLAGAQSYGA